MDMGRLSGLFSLLLTDAGAEEIAVLRYQSQLLPDLIGVQALERLATKSNLSCLVMPETKQEIVDHTFARAAWSLPCEATQYNHLKL